MAPFAIFGVTGDFRAMRLAFKAPFFEGEDAKTLQGLGTTEVLGMASRFLAEGSRRMRRETLLIGRRRVNPPSFLTIAFFRFEGGARRAKGMY